MKGHARILAALEEMEREGCTSPDAVPGDRFVALDFETATSHRDSACALGAAMVEDGRIVSERSWLFRPPGNRYDMGNIAIHGIHPRDTEDSPDFGETWEEISEFVGGTLVVAHNAAFDLYVLRDSLLARGLAVSLDYGCTVALARKVLPDMANHRLDTMARHYGLQLNHHDATSDARACANIGLRLSAQSGLTLPETFGQYRVRLKTLIVG